ncbi:MAG TPA: imidazoleglycerol-phosphate dehydratase, partial [Gemmatimonadales bacterium]|nr:imidazoleglycerol-phosphate dehydratase [Gemmatimonadales bacterium]
MSTVTRTTKETDVRVEAAIGAGKATVATTVPFLDHMLTALAAYAGIDLAVTARGDLRHHLIEDVAITVGEAVRGLIPA